MVSPIQKQLFYKPGMRSKDLIAELRDFNLPVFCDSADPRLIDEIYLGGVDIRPVDKFPGSIVAGIDYMQGVNIHVTKDSYDLNDEYHNYVWDKDKNGNYINVPIDKYNHGIDACRYYVLGKLLGRVKSPSATAMYNR